MSGSYPEHLNPFAEGGKNRTKLSISHSFKELKRTLRRSFRIKKREADDVPIRHKPETPRPSATSYQSYQPHPTQELALPRSRFRERLSMRPAIIGANPFDEDEENTYSKMTAARRKLKKRAPLPPNKSHSSQDVNSENLGIPSSESNWSLTSGDTDYTYSIGNMSRGDSEVEINSSAMLEQFKDFNEEMQKLKDDSNNNIITKEENTKEPCIIPDLVISCPSDSESVKLESRNEENAVLGDIVIEDTKVSLEETFDCKKETTIENNKETVVDNNLESVPGETVDNKKETVIENNTETVTENNLESVPAETVDNRENTVIENNEETVIENNEASATEDDGYLYHEKKSLYIAGSRDDLEQSTTYTGSVSLYITGSSDNLDASNNNECDIDNKNDNEDIVEADNNDETPVPKQRKNKLSKNTLLGI